MKDVPPPSDAQLCWGILGTGRIAQRFADAMADSVSGSLRAIGSRTAEGARRFAETTGHWEIHRYGSYEELIAAADIDAVYIATPHPFHAVWAVRAAAAGKHVLCEKPAAMNAAQLEPVIREFRSRGLLFAEAFMYRCHPQTLRLVELLREGRIGRPQRMEGDFSFISPRDTAGRLWNAELGGGAILDVGCYPVSMCRLVAGIAEGKDFAEPTGFHGLGRRDLDTGVDVSASLLLHFPGELHAALHCAINARGRNELMIAGSEGRITLTSPWFCNGETHIETPDGKRETLPVIDERDLYSYEIDAFADSVSCGAPEMPAMTPADSLGNARVLDRWRGLF